MNGPDGVDLLGGISSPDPSIWADVEWMRDLLDVPTGAAWPRLMSAPHPDAVGSYGDDITEWVGRVRGVGLRWWQRLALRRQMEHDADGRLVWGTTILSTPRRCGKSVLLREALAWRYIVGPTMWGSQTCMVQGHTLTDARAIWDPLCDWLQERDREDTHTNRHTSSLQARSRTSGSLLIARAIRGAYGSDIDLGIIDEAWGVPVEPVEQAIRPAMQDRSSPQLILTSTAHDSPTTLMPDLLLQAAAEVSSPTSTLLMYWGADLSRGIGGPEEWRSWAPHWTMERQRQMGEAVGRLQRQRPTPRMPSPMAALYTQWLNVWLAPEQTTEQGGWDAAERVAACVARSLQHDGPPVMALDVEASGMSYCVALATPAGVEVRPGLSIAAAAAWWAESGAYRVVARSAVLPSLPPEWCAEGLRTAEEAAALASMSRAAMAGGLRVQADGRAWAAQCGAVRTTAGPAGPAISARLSRGPTQMVSAAAMAWWIAERDSATSGQGVY